MVQRVSQRKGLTAKGRADLSCGKWIKRGCAPRYIAENILEPGALKILPKEFEILFDSCGASSIYVSIWIKLKTLSVEHLTRQRIGLVWNP